MYSSKFTHREILINVTPYQKRIVVLDDKRISKVFFDQPHDVTHKGSVYKGTVLNVKESLNAAFVDIGTQDEPGFLRLRDIIGYQEPQEGDPPVNIQDLIQEGQEIIVQVIKEPINTKGPSLSMDIKLVGQLLIGLPYSDSIGVSNKVRDFKLKKEIKAFVQSSKQGEFGFIIRTLGTQADEKELKREVNLLQERWWYCQELFAQNNEPCLLYQNSNIIENTLREYVKPPTTTITVDDKKEQKNINSYLNVLSSHKATEVSYHNHKESLFDYYKLTEEIKKTFQSKVPLRRGGYLIIEQTEALVSIDVNTGGRTYEKDQSLNSLSTNLDAAREVAKQILLRDLGGIIVIDFIDMYSEKHKQQVEDEFRKAIRNDETPVNFSLITDLGLMEISRKRIRENLVSIHSNICPMCNGNRYILKTTDIIASIDDSLHRIFTERKHKHILLAAHYKICSRIIKNRGNILKYWETKYNLKIELYEDEESYLPNFSIFEASSGKDITKNYSRSH